MSSQLSILALRFFFLVSRSANFQVTEAELGFKVVASPVIVALYLPKYPLKSPPVALA